MGEVFAGRYELLDLIGEGGMGSVWRVWDGRMQRVVAAKVLKQSDASTLLRFVREQAVRIHHPHVVVPLGWAGEDDRVLFTMPIIRGGSVATLVADNGPLPPLLVAEILRQVLSGLVAVHAVDIVHRDIKPANILLDATGTGRPHAYLSDFGIAVDLRGPRWTATGVVTGTPGYLAPEVESSGEITFAADLYAAGQVAQTMLSGARPVERGAAMLRPIDVPASLWSVVHALVAASPADRPASAQAALAALQTDDLGWRPEVIGDVEVFDQLPADESHPMTAVASPQLRDGADPGSATAGTHIDTRDDTDNDLTVARIASVPLDEGSAGADDKRIPLGGKLIGAVAVTVAVAAGVLVWSPWSGSASKGPATTTTTTSRSTGPAKTTTSSTSSSPSSSPSTSSTTRTQGTVNVNPVIVRVGQPCEFSDVGQGGRTTGGVDVVCTYGGGNYTWQRR